VTYLCEKHSWENSQVPGYTPGMPQVNEMGSFCLSEKAGKKFPKSWVIGRDFAKSSPKKTADLEMEKKRC